MKVSKSLRAFFNDSVWSIAGLVLMNIVAQFVVYPFWSRELGSEAYGEVLSLLSMMNILAISAGCACNSTRIVKSAGGPTGNGDYGIILLAMSVVAVPFGIGVYRLSVPESTATDVALYVILIILTMWRFYSDVQYRLNLDYKGYFRYYLVISLGYLIGIVLFSHTGYWPIALIPGELAGLCVAFFYRSTIRSGFLRRSGQCSQILRMTSALFGANLISHLIFNGDRLLLNMVIGGNAVTTYYLASLLGKTMSLITTPLNSVIMGYLARYKGSLTVRIMNLASLLCVACIIVATSACTLASHILIKILYPENYVNAAPYFIVGNMAQVLYFAANVVVTILLRFTKARNQVYVDVSYACAFVVLCVPAALFAGVEGFCYAMLLTSAIRLAVGILLGYRNGKKKENDDRGIA